MCSASLVLRRADEGDLSYVERLLEANDLPTADVRSKSESFYVGYVRDTRAGNAGGDAVADEDDSPVGVGGIEQFGADALLRSVVVEESARGEGWGTALCSALETEARESGVEALYLLTTTAAPFFADRGFEEIERSDAPAAIRESREFADLCPSTATCMRKSESSR